MTKETQKQADSDERIRNSIEGKFGQAKRKFSLNLLMAKLADTAQTAIAITFLVINLSAILRRVIYAFFGQFFQITTFLGWMIRKNYLMAICRGENLSIRLTSFAS